MFDKAKYLPMLALVLVSVALVVCTQMNKALRERLTASKERNTAFLAANDDLMSKVKALSDANQKAADEVVARSAEAARLQSELHRKTALLNAQLREQAQRRREANETDAQCKVWSSQLVCAVVSDSLRFEWESAATAASDSVEGNEARLRTDTVQSD